MVDASVLLLVLVHCGNLDLGNEGDVLLRRIVELVESGVVDGFEGFFEFLHPLGVKGIGGS